MAMTPAAGRRPRSRIMSQRSLVIAISGAEQPYPVYNFSGRRFLERPQHNPFANLAPAPPSGGDGWHGEGWHPDGWHGEGWRDPV